MVRSVTARRQLRWIVWGTALGSRAVRLRLRAAVRVRPAAAARRSSSARCCSGSIPLAFASAIVRYRLMDVEVIIKRALVYAAALAAIAAIYAVLLRIAGAIFLRDADQQNPVIALLATFVVVLLSRPVKNAIQTGLDRVYYRDRYDYRRALVGFARDLNSDLDLAAPERAARAPRHRDAGRRSHGADARAGVAAPATSSPSRTPGFADAPPPLSPASEVGDAPDVGPHARARRNRSRCAGSTRAKSISGATPGSTTSFRASRRKARLR